MPTAKADAPRPKLAQPLFAKEVRRPFRPAPAPAGLPDGITLRELNSGGTFTLARVTYIVGGQHRHQQVIVIADGETIAVSNFDGEILIDHKRPPAGVTYVGNGRPRGPRPKNTELSPVS